MAPLNLALILSLLSQLSFQVSSSGLPPDQLTLLGNPQWSTPPDINPTGETVCNLSEWSRSIKSQFLAEISDGRANEWVIVMGNEAGDTDSMAGAIGWAYHLTHLKKHPQKAISLLQTVEDALDLRPENQLALERSRMSPRHRDLLTIDELPIKPFELSRHIGGIVLVDHNFPDPGWRHAPVVSIIDHHVDMKTNLTAVPRVITTSASCSSLVSKLILDANEEGKHREFGKRSHHFPDELLFLLLRAIALDSGGLKSSKTYDVDLRSALRLFRRTSTYQDRLDAQMMGELQAEMAEARSQLKPLDLRDLLRRDWKANALRTKSSDYPILTLGFASIPYSLVTQINRTPEATIPEWFAIQRAFTSEIGADVSVILTKFSPTDIKEHELGDQERELVIVVAHGWGKRLNSSAATDLFKTLCAAAESGLEGLVPWHRPDGKSMLPRRMAWRGLQVGRKVVMPLVQDAARTWAYQQTIQNHE
ncbi:uncharacterized protein MELLADRAFT_49610 [Melampsora larici-populina 98AG31]|uniref:DHHA2 domain-containing protein n=1 Tax=Melampsora larici-populina (strain 98AG31 / pathotype 3-4-7) TaxID=747676 RepID=F4RWS1_MELLP|nr:uncharacterized protein MELLADRAFT_49610 [Melampsora larici-populina 98AG31]EGG03178.1 hypothetical protein MELLADRAFT_49610 [Melampsora larici-populina 98AG31]